MSINNKKELAMTRFPITSNNPQSPDIGLRKSQSFVSPIYQKSKFRKEPLPPINSPFLKQTVNNLFQQQIQQNRFPRRYEEDLKLSKLGHNREQNMFKTNLPLSNSYSLGVQKLPKSHSLKKHDIFRQKYDNPQSRSYLKGKTIKIINHEKSNTESSEQKQTSSKHLFKNLIRISEKEKQLLSRSQQRPQIRQNKESKPSTFIIMQKLNKDLYLEQKEQIRLVRGLVNNSRNNNLNGMIKVKNYIKFMPTTLQ